MDIFTFDTFCSWYLHVFHLLLLLLLLLLLSDTARHEFYFTQASEYLLYDLYSADLCTLSSGGTFYYFLQLLHYILEKNVVVFTLLHVAYLLVVVSIYFSDSDFTYKRHEDIIKDTALLKIKPVLQNFSWFVTHCKEWVCREDFLFQMLRVVSTSTKERFPSLTKRWKHPVIYNKRKDEAIYASV